MRLPLLGFFTIILLNGYPQGLNMAGQKAPTYSTVMLFPPSLNALRISDSSFAAAHKRFHGKSNLCFQNSVGNEGYKAGFCLLPVSFSLSTPYHYTVTTATKYEYHFSMRVDGPRLFIFNPYTSVLFNKQLKIENKYRVSKDIVQSIIQMAGSMLMPLRVSGMDQPPFLPHKVP